MVAHLIIPVGPNEHLPEQLLLGPQSSDFRNRTVRDELPPRFQGGVLFFGRRCVSTRRCVMINSTVSLASLAGNHDFCARRWENREEDCACTCRCNEEEQSVAMSGVMDLAQFRSSEA
jgi:hypothetical protein